MAGKKKIEGANVVSENWGGKRSGSGRKSLGELVKVREILDEAIAPEAVMQKLTELIENGDYRAIDLYMKYRVGQPKQEMAIEMNSTQDVNFSLNNLVTFTDDTDRETEQGED